MADRHIHSPTAVTHQLAIKQVFEGLSSQEQHYAHHLSKAAWHGSRILMRQTSPESTDIFDFIIDIYESCNGEWGRLPKLCNISVAELEAFLEYSALFLCNLGNFFGAGNQKFVPDLSAETLSKIAQISTSKSPILERVIEPILSIPPFSLGFPSENAQSNYYPGEERITREEVAAVAHCLDKSSIEPENTRVRKTNNGEKIVFEVLQASISLKAEAERDGRLEVGEGVHIVKGDHAEEMSKICSALKEAIKYTANENQSRCLSEYIKSFTTGSMEAYRNSQKSWVADVSPRVENIIGFVESYRDPSGTRAEWEGVVCIADADETRRLKQFVDQSTEFIRLLPWAVPDVNDGMGPFEKSLFEAPDFTIVHALAFCASLIWEAVNLPNYNDIRETCGFKNIVFANRMNANHNPANPCPYVDSSEKEAFIECNHIVRFVLTSIHELLGHGTGKLMTETSDGNFNFDKESPPINPLTMKPIDSFYRPGQTWLSVFGDIATSVEECRATLVSHYLFDNKGLLSIFGFTEHSDITADDLIYNTYLHIGVEGLRGLEHYDVKNHTWGDAHKRGDFAILKHLLQDGGGFMRVDHDSATSNLTVHVDRTKFLSHGKPAIGRFLCKVHIWRCIGDVKSCRDFYEPLSAVEGQYEEWRQIVCSKPEPRWKFVQANTSLKEGKVELEVYEESNAGIIKSWAEREV